jgi:hypothetical protein
MPTCANGKNKPHSKGNGKKKAYTDPPSKKKRHSKAKQTVPKASKLTLGHVVRKMQKNAENPRTKLSPSSPSHNHYNTISPSLSAPDSAPHNPDGTTRVHTPRHHMPPSLRN